MTFIMFIAVTDKKSQHRVKHRSVLHLCDCLLLHLAMMTLCVDFYIMYKLHCLITGAALAIGMGVVIALMAILIIILGVVLVLVVIKWRTKKPYDVHQGKL